MYGLAMFSPREICVAALTSCDSLLKRHENDPILKRIIIGDEKWVVYNNVNARSHGAKKMNRHKPFPNPIFTKKDDAVCLVGFSRNRFLSFNRKGVVFHQDNARAHTSLVTRQKILQLEWDTMPHSPDSLDLAPSDYYLLRSLQNFLEVKPSPQMRRSKTTSISFFPAKTKNFMNVEVCYYK